jgi:hypothetical protein
MITSGSRAHDEGGSQLPDQSMSGGQRAINEGVSKEC